MFWMFYWEIVRNIRYSQGYFVNCLTLLMCLFWINTEETQRNITSSKEIVRVQLKRERYCIYCNLHKIEHEYHFIENCPCYIEISTRYIKQYHYTRSSLFNVLTSWYQILRIYDWIWVCIKKAVFHWTSLNIDNVLICM